MNDVNNSCVFPSLKKTTAWTDICSSVIAPALPYYRPSMALCNICIHHIHVDYAGGRATHAAVAEGLGEIFK